MVGFLTKTLFSLVPKPKNLLGNKLGVVSPYPRSIDDIAIPYIRPNNYPQSITVSDSSRYDITALVFLKTYGNLKVRPPRSVKEANYWRESSPFWNSSSIKRKLWSKLLHAVNLNEAKLVIAREVMDYLYKQIYIDKQPIIGVRVILFNGSTNEVINPKIIRDPWFSTNAFNGVEIDRRSLDSWGIRTGSYRDNNNKLSTKNSLPFDLNTITTLNFKNKMLDLDVDLEEIIKGSLLDSESKLKTIKDFSTRYKIKSSLRTMLIGTKFNKLFASLMVAKLRTYKFKKVFTESKDRSELVTSIINQIVYDYIDKELEQLAAKQSEK